MAWKVSWMYHPSVAAALRVFAHSARAASKAVSATDADAAFPETTAAS